MKKTASLYQHFAPEERAFVEKIIDICQQVEETYSYSVTSFLNPRDEEIAQSIAAHFQLCFFSSRQICPTEFVRVIIAPDYYVLDEKDFEIMVLEIHYPRKFHQITHSQVLGTLLHQLGIRREFIGDILVDDTLLVLLDRKFGELAQSTVQKISRTPVTWKERPLAFLPVTEAREYQSVQLLLSSLRLDKIVSAAFKRSRSQAVKLIETGQVKVNYREVTQAGKVIEQGQLISVRGFGRVRFKEVVGQSKQGKLKAEIEIIKK